MVAFTALLHPRRGAFPLRSKAPLRGVVRSHSPYFRGIADKQRIYGNNMILSLRDLSDASAKAFDLVLAVIVVKGGAYHRLQVARFQIEPGRP